MLTAAVVVIVSVETALEATAVAAVLVVAVGCLQTVDVCELYT